jgi:Ca-activated chloride channel family protein
MKTRVLFCFVLILAIAGLFPAPALADGIIIPQPTLCPLSQRCPTPCSPTSDVIPCPPHPTPYPLAELAVRYHHVTVKIVDQVAVTHVDQVFYNPNDSSIEGDYFFPLPADAAVSNFTLWIDNQPVQGQVLDAEQARQKYDDIVRSLRDPALLEYAGRGAIEAHIYPIAPQGERHVELEYTQALSTENGLVHYVYPLNTEKFSTQPLDSVSVSVTISSAQPIRAVYSPTHTISVDRTDDKHVSASYEAEKVRPDTDFGLYYSIGTAEAFHLLSYRNASDPTDPDGF